MAVSQRLLFQRGKQLTGESALTVVGCNRQRTQQHRISAWLQSGRGDQASIVASDQKLRQMLGLEIGNRQGALVEQGEQVGKFIEPRCAQGAA